MGHYDSCREGYCPSCGAAPGNIIGGLCEFCDKPRNKQQVATPWFEYVRPVRIGVYQIIDDEMLRYSYWNGTRWATPGSSPHAAYMNSQYGHFGRYNFTWRGLYAD